MSGIDAVTGRPIDGWSHTVQSIDKILSTQVGERVMRRWLGGVGAQLLGRLMTPRTILVFRAAIAVSLDLHEPRFKLSAIRFEGNTTDAVRLGHLAFVLEGTYRPRAHLGDLRAEPVRFLRVGLTRNGISVAPQA